MELVKVIEDSLPFRVELHVHGAFVPDAKVRAKDEGQNAVSSELPVIH